MLLLPRAAIFKVCDFAYVTNPTFVVPRLFWIVLQKMRNNNTAFSHFSKCEQFLRTYAPKIISVKHRRMQFTMEQAQYFT